MRQAIEVQAWNYLYFRNGDTGKPYYYFITNIEYISDTTIELFLELDVLQTYLFDFELLPCFIERQHTETDEIGEHTIDEGLEIGELVTAQQLNIDPGALCIMVMSTINPNGTTEETAAPALPYMYNRVFSGVKIWAVDPTKWAEWGNQIDVLDELGKTDAILSMWMYPKALVTLGGESTWDAAIANPVEAAVDYKTSPYLYTFSKRYGTLDGYTPKNRKLYCYPYNFAYCTNNEGASAVYKYERFSSDLMGFTLSGSLSPDGGIHITPMNYNGITYNYHEGMLLKGYPTCAWDSDVYKMWLAQNQNQQNLAMVSGGLKIAAGAVGAIGSLATGNVMGAVGSVAGAVNGAQQIGSLLAQRADMEIVPPQAKGGFSSSVNVTDSMLAFSFYFKSINAEHARIIDDYFTMYGYKINRVQTPKLNARPAYTYVKTIGCHIKGGMCTDDIVKIESIFDNGITFWQYGDRIGDYTINNEPYA